MTMVEAVCAALARAMDDDPDVVVFGEDVGVDGGVFRATDGLLERFGPDRVLDAPISESLFVGLGVLVVLAIVAGVTGVIIEPPQLPLRASRGFQA